MKGFITGIGGGLFFMALYPLLPAHPILGVVLNMLATALIIVLALVFWTGAVGIKCERRVSDER